MKKYFYFSLFFLLFNNVAFAANWERQAEYLQNNGTWGATGWVSNQELERQRLDSPALYRGICDKTLMSLNGLINGRKINSLSKNELSQVEAYSLALKDCPAEYADLANMMLVAVKQIK